MSALLVFVVKALTFWDQALPPLNCIADIVHTHFKNPAVEICGSIEHMDVLVTAVMETATVYLSSRPSVHPVHTDILYLMSPEELPPGVSSVNRNVVIISPTITGASLIFRKTRLANAILLHQLLAYSWFPYDPNECHLDDHLTLIDVCENGGYTNHSAMFMNIIPEKFEGCPLHVHRAFCLPVSYGYFTSSIDPPEDEILEVIVEFFNFSVIDHYPIDGTDDFLHYSRDGELVGAGLLLYSQEVDLSLHCCLTRPENFSMYEILPAFREETMVWFVPAPEPAPFISGLYSGFNVIIWSLVISSYIIFTVVYYIATNFYNEPRSFSHCLLLALAFLTGDIVKRSKLTFLRVFEIIFSIYIIHIIAFYESGLLWNLFRTPMNAPIETADEALDIGLDVYLRPDTKNAYNRSNHQFWNKILDPNDHFSIIYMSFQCIIDRKCFFLGLRKIDTTVFHFEFPELSFEHNVRILAESIDSFQAFVNISPGNPLRTLLSKKVAQVIEAGIPEFCLQTTLNKIGHEKQEVEKHKKSLKIVNLQSAFYFCGILLIISLLIFVVEVLIEQFYGKKDRGKPLRSTMFHTAARFRVDHPLIGARLLLRERF